MYIYTVCPRSLDPSHTVYLNCSLSLSLSLLVSFLLWEQHYVQCTLYIVHDEKKKIWIRRRLLIYRCSPWDVVQLCFSKHNSVQCYDTNGRSSIKFLILSFSTFSRHLIISVWSYIAFQAEMRCSDPIFRSIPGIWIRALNILQISQTWRET